MRLFFHGDVDEIFSGLEALVAWKDFTIQDEGFPIKVVRWENHSLHVSKDEHQGLICFNEKIHFFRAFSLFLENTSRYETFQIDEDPQFDMNGVMLDCSRNAVMKPGQVERLIRVMAMMGLNMLMLYMEDTYEIEQQPYFGYMRGRYSKGELKQLDDYAHQFGIELLPSIQTLAHLSTFLRWDVARDLKDTDDILLADSPNTYKLIKQMIENASVPFRTKRIHIGMDEAHMLGKGQYIKQNGYRPTFEIMNRHLKNVLKLTNELGLKPMIWSDMYFRMASQQGDYYDKEAVIAEQVIQDMPEDVQFVYWDYYHEDEDFYRDFLNKHKAFGSKPLFAGGIWTWNGIAINYKKTFNTMNPAMSACKKEGIREVFSTLWGDDGAETSVFTSLLGLQLMAEHGYAKEINWENVKKRFECCTGADMGAFLLLSELDHPPNSSPDFQLEPDNPSKFLLWQDPLIGLYDKQIEPDCLNPYYQKLGQKLREAKNEVGEWSSVFDVPIQVCSVLSIKSELGFRLKSFYDTSEMEELRQVLDRELPELKRRVETLKNTHYEQWMKHNKPFGWEVLDIRYGGLIARIETSRHRLGDYLEGRISSIPELEEERLSYTSDHKKQGYVRSNVYKQIVTPNVF